MMVDFGQHLGSESFYEWNMERLLEVPKTKDYWSAYYRQGERTLIFARVEEMRCPSENHEEALATLDRALESIGKSIRRATEIEAEQDHWTLTDWINAKAHSQSELDRLLDKPLHERPERWEMLERKLERYVDYCQLTQDNWFNYLIAQNYD